MKQDVVANAFKNFSRLPASAIPSISPTLPSPKEYGYRTKLTPHFQTPPTSGFSNSSGKNKKGKGRGNGKEVEVKSEENEVAVAKEWELTIGFEQKGRKRVIDIEECVIATQVINDALTIERQKVKELSLLSSYLSHGLSTLRSTVLTRDDRSFIALSRHSREEQQYCSEIHSPSDLPMRSDHRHRVQNLMFASPIIMQRSGSRLATSNSNRWPDRFSRIIVQSYRVY